MGDDSHDTPDALVIRCLQRGVNALAVDGASNVRDPIAFAHASDRATWASPAIEAGFRHLDEVAAQVQHEIHQLCRAAAEGQIIRALP